MVFSTILPGQGSKSVSQLLECEEGLYFNPKNKLCDRQENIDFAQLYCKLYEL